MFLTQNLLTQYFWIFNTNFFNTKFHFWQKKHSEQLKTASLSYPATSDINVALLRQ